MTKKPSFLKRQGSTAAEEAILCAHDALAQEEAKRRRSSVYSDFSGPGRRGDAGPVPEGEGRSPGRDTNVSVADFGNEDDDQDHDESMSRLLSSAIPLFFSGIQFVFIKMTDTALAGHVDAKFLTVTAFSDFYTQLYSVVTSSRVLGSLAAPAVGAKDYQLVGAYLQTAIVVLFALAVPVVFLNCCAGLVLHYGLKVPWDLAAPAGYYAAVLSLCLPARILMAQLSQFLVAQECADIPSSVSFVPPVLNFLFGMQFVLGIPLTAYGFGFFACPWVTVFVEYVGLLAVFAAMYVRSDPTTRDLWKCWPKESVLPKFLQCGGGEVLDGKNLQNQAPTMASATADTNDKSRDESTKDNKSSSYVATAIVPKIRPFLDLHLPQVAALSSDFWRFSAIGWMSSWPSINGAGVFNAGYRIAWLNMTLTSSLATAGSMVIGAKLGRGDGAGAERMFWKCLQLILAILVVSSIIWVVFAKQVAVIFAKDQSFVDAFASVSVSFSCFVFTMNLSVALESFLITLKKNALVLKATLIGSWLGQVPAVFVLLVGFGESLSHVYWGVSIGYFILCALYWNALRSVLWHQEAELAQEFMRV
ncbi:unnamed protein product [Amoebophrya sp. A120]|nr:unnamed protein product [Amoebophrya sp. A120]|eukprot:GSA120T00002996001.1